MRFLVDLQDIRGLSGRGREGIVRFEFNSVLSSFFFLTLLQSLSLSPTRGYVFGFVGLAVGSPRVKGKKN